MLGMGTLIAVCIPLCTRALLRLPEGVWVPLADFTIPHHSLLAASSLTDPYKQAWHDLQALGKLP